MLDIRFPIGLMFSIVGLIITIYGLATMGQDAMYVKSLNVNVNLLSGIGCLIFGLLMLLFSDPVRERNKK
jgi:ABC-type phosphate transport system permease subunit